jgi:tetratricopeptide (TPR) repeat protein
MTASNENALPGTAELFVGRERERVELDSALADAMAGRGRMLLIAGEPGIGKTRLAERVAASAEERGANVIWGRCWEGEGAPAFWPWVQVIRSYMERCDVRALAAQMGIGAPHIAHIVPELRTLLPDLPPAAPLDSEQARFRLYDACATFLRCAAGDTPLMLVLEDLHWADKSSLLLLQFLAREVSAARMLIVGTYRDVEVSPGHPLGEVLPRLRRERTVERILIRGLPEEEVRAMLVAFRGDEVPQSFVRNLSEETAGNPFFIKEILRHLLEEGLAWREGDHWVGRGDEIRLPESIRDVIGRRLARLSEPCTKLLAGASVIGQEFGTETLRRVTELGKEAIVELLEEAAASRIIEAAPQAIGRHRFAHALVREALYSGLKTIERLQLHRRVAEVFERTPGAQLTELAHHYFESLPGGDVAKAVDYAIRAGDRATEQLASVEAANLYARALQALDLEDEPDERLRCELLLKLGNARWDAGGFVDPGKVFRQAAELAERIHEPELLANAVLGLSGPGVGFAVSDFSAAEIELYEKALARLDPRDTPLRAKLLAKWSARLTFYRSDPRATVIAREAIEVARRAGDNATLASVLQVTSFSTWTPENVEERLATADEIVRLAEEVGDVRLAGEGHRIRADCHLELGDPDAADREVQAQFRFAERSRQPHQRWFVALKRAAVAVLEGRFAESEDHLRQAGGAEAEVAQGGLYGTAYVAGLLREHVLAPGDDDLAIVEANQDTAFVRSFAAWTYFRRGRVAEARRLFEQVAANDFAGLPRDYMWLFLMSSLITELVIALEDTRRAAIVHDLLLPYARHCSLAWAVICYGSVSRSLGRLAAMLGRFDAAEQHFETALEMNRRLRGRPWVAHTQHDYARMLHRRALPGDREKAEELIGEALATAREIGMTILEVAIAKTLAETGLVIREEKAPPPPPTTEAVFRKDEDFWTIAYEGSSLRLKDSKGLQYLAELLRHRDDEIHAVDLAAGGEPGVSQQIRGDAGEVLDAQARSEYRQRLEDLRGELEEATRWGDAGRAASLGEEIEFLTDELSSAYGAGGRVRKAGDVANRARKAVTSRIRETIARIGKEHPALGRHLDNAIRTGVFCAYQPDRAPHWRF